jgi:hypothetical protein
MRGGVGIAARGGKPAPYGKGGRECIYAFRQLRKIIGGRSKSVPYEKDEFRIAHIAYRVSERKEGLGAY